MKILLRKLLFVFLSFLFFSCSDNEGITIIENEDTTTNPVFFNLNVGNTWVYKKYENSHDNPTQFTFSGIVDTVKIIDIEDIQGFTFAKKSSKKVNIYNDSILSVTYSYVRVNNLGHLVKISDINPPTLSETTGIVLHPGFDTSFSYNQTFSNQNDIYGNVEYHLYDPINMIVEGNNYLVSPYNGVFTPSTNYPELISKTIENNYSQNIGMVKLVCHTLSGNYTWEERLVSYNLIE